MVLPTVVLPFFKEKNMRTTKVSLNVLPRITAIALVLFAGNDIAELGARVGIIPCVKVLRGSTGSLVVPTFEMYINFTQQTLLLSNFVSDPHIPLTAR
jgi:hypothetical protein